ncbi:Uncharacterized protein BP5553_00608 [Venustampulla echinocandica]|uniref:Uncharacterized protein n=1 Tax=Venustampulla echinocandica TaxID=2656787 RepID=A0A370TYM4_9HELO|nr:Uncharacterized protein BP5553_00608 [Venustampulla echinocandica]RDL40629.1 Uncharacterized protein BP5553_00608 [Venustampulla echinocandica]
MATNGSFTQQEQYKNAPEQYPATTGAADSNTGSASGNDLSKDEVGWYFVEQYYTTLSKSPEKLHLFYGKRSQFVSGLEAEVAPVSVGRSAIQERIRELDFQDCKVRVSNVDSQASFDNIVIQVIGETSNKSAELKKFVQTFVLAQQPTGYFVLNDIFRYINEEGEEETLEPAAQEEAAARPLTEDVEMPKAQAAAEEAAPAPLAAEVVDKKSEEAKSDDVAAVVPSINGTGEAAGEAEKAPVAATKAEEDVAPKVAEKEVEETKEPEKPKEAAPSPAATRPTTEAKPAEPAQPAGPAKPLSWASRAAAAVGTAPKPAVPAVAPKTSTPPAQTRSVPPAAKPAAAQPAAAAAPAASSEKDKENTAPGSGWQTAGDHAKRQNRPQSISAAPEDKGTMAYIRNVTEKITPEDLRGALESFGPLVYFDINRSKNCAFVEYGTAEGYQAAANANPHQIGGENIYVEPRRPKATAYGGNSYSGGRGGVNTRGRGGFQDGRQGGQGGRGNYGQNRGRGGPGGAPAPRGRGPQAANA